MYGENISIYSFYVFYESGTFITASKLNLEWAIRIIFSKIL